MKNRIVFLFLLVLVFSMEATAKYVAVLETGLDQKDLLTLSERQYLTNVLREEAVKVLPAEMNFTIMTRENINVMLPPGKTIEDCEGSCLAETGKNIAADYVAQARVGRFGTNYTISAELYETAGNKLVASFNGRGSDIEALIGVINEKSPEFFKKVRGGSSGFSGASGFGDFSSGSEFSFQGTKKFIVEIVTNPAGALPTVDGKGFQKCTSTPCKVQLEAGEHRVVVSKDRYDDAEIVANVTENNQKISLNMTPNFGTLNLQPEIKFGNPADLLVTIDGATIKGQKFVVAAGMHTVKLVHPCYDPVEFKVGIEKGKTETFNQSLVRGKGALELDAEWNGEPQAVPVYVDGADAGSTPFAGEVPMCATIAVDDGASRQNVNVKLKWHEVVKAVYLLKNNPGVAMAPDANTVARNKAKQGYADMECELNGKCDQPIGQSIPTNVKKERKIHWIPVGISAAVMVAGGVVAFIGEKQAKSAHDKVPMNEAEYRKNKDDIHNAQAIRLGGIIGAAVGAVGVGLSFAF